MVEMPRIPRFEPTDVAEFRKPRSRAKLDKAPAPKAPDVAEEAAQREKQALSELRKGVGDLVAEMARMELQGEYTADTLLTFEDRIDDLRMTYKDSLPNASRTERDAFFAGLEQLLERLRGNLPSSSVEEAPAEELLPEPPPVEATRARSRIERNSDHSVNFLGHRTQTAGGYSRRRATMPRSTESAPFPQESPQLSLPDAKTTAWAREQFGIADMQDFFTKYDSLARDTERSDELLSPEAQAFLARHEARDVVHLLENAAEKALQPKGFFGKLRNIFSSPSPEMRQLQRVVDELQELTLEPEPLPADTRPTPRKKSAPRRPARPAPRTIYGGVTKQ